MRMLKYLLLLATCCLAMTGTARAQGGAQFEDSDGWNYNFNDGGQLVDLYNQILGYQTSCGSFYVLNVEEEGYAPESIPVYTDEDHTNAACGLQTMSGLQVRRYIYVPQGGNFARILNCFSNSAEDPITVTVRIGTFGGDETIFRNESLGEFGNPNDRAMYIDSSGDCNDDAADRVALLPQRHPPAEREDPRRRGRKQQHLGAGALY